MIESFKFLLIFLFLSIFFLQGCTTTPVPEGVNSNIFRSTELKEVESFRYIKGPTQKINSETQGSWYLIEQLDPHFKNDFKLIYECYAIRVHYAENLESDKLLDEVDVLKHSDLNGFLLEKGCINIEKELLKNSLNTGMSIKLVSKGKGFIKSAKYEFSKAGKRTLRKLEKMDMLNIRHELPDFPSEKALDGFEYSRGLGKTGGDYRLNYKNKEILIKIPGNYIKTFLAKADLIKQENKK